MSAPAMLCPRCWARRAMRSSCELCRGLGTVPDLALSPHFRLSECLASETALRRGIPNDPSAEIVDHLRESAARLWEPVRALLGVKIRVTSGYRSQALNAAIGGSSRTSAHLRGFALDCDPIGMPLAEAMSRIEKSALVWDQCIFEYSRWIHLGWKGPNGRQARQLLMIFDPGEYLVWSPSDHRITGGTA